MRRDNKLIDQDLFQVYFQSQQFHDLKDAK